MSIVRAEVIARMRGAFRKGLSASRFMKDMKSAGLSYRRTTMLADWRSVNEVEKKEGLLRFVRKDRYPTGVSMASVTWETSKEYMYKVKVESVIRLGEPITERFVNIMSDVPMTPAMLEAEVEERWGEWEKYAAETITKLQVWSAVRKVME
ncbi:hypothetical protein LCGC14_1914190 [marine sediment metagenome]|uniref:Uncharacterized protein n=1 Tax=marine sediment metagenome TaxID=412755 RepID=A0A0F9FTD0_9ZZZZ